MTTARDCELIADLIKRRQLTVDSVNQRVGLSAELHLLYAEDDGAYRALLKRCVVYMNLERTLRGLSPLIDAERDRIELHVWVDFHTYYHQLLREVMDRPVVESEVVIVGYMQGEVLDYRAVK